MPESPPQADRNSEAGAACKPAAALPPGLYLVATPIGNLRDITLRALDTLRAADIIACEDTRRTRALLSHYSITGKLAAHHDHNEAQSGQSLVRQIADGKSVALVSDAGTPLISDPGFALVAAVREAGFPVTSVPGASAPLVALQLSGLPSDRFCFAGFPPVRSGQRRRFFGEFASLPASLIFFESPRRLAASLAEMAVVFGDRRACIARELTKMHEEVRAGGLADLARAFAEAEPPKGEVVIVVERPGQGVRGLSGGELDALLEEALRRSRLREAVDEVAAITGMQRRMVYERALSLKRGEG